MSSGDRGGITAIISMIKSTKVPIICICNDRSSDKIRSLAGHCLDVKFIAPNKAQVVRRLM
jgi:replication factor C subunit 1